MKCKLIVFICIYFFTINTIQSQIKSGKITYERKTNLYKKFKNNGDVKEWLKEEDKNKLDVFELYFNDSLSVFKPQESDLVERMSWSTNKNSVYQNRITNKRLTIKTIWGERFLLDDSIRLSKWKITENKRNVCGYQCRKAILNVNDSTRLYAWFCSELDATIGPESLGGLPGVILGLATEDGGVIYFAKTVEIIKPTLEVLLPKKSKEKLYKTAELKAQITKDFGKEKWGKMMLYNQFEVW
jgi:GLPGLI family protein